MNVISMELHEEQITELQYQIEKLESEKHCLEEELEDRYKSYKETGQTVLNIYNENLKKIDDMQKLNSKLVKNNKASNRDFFILAVAYAITLMIMIYLFIL